MMDLVTFASVFGLVFLAELGDKTQLAVIAQTCRHRRPWPVFVGASAALISVTIAGVAAGRLMAQLLPAGVVRTASAVSFLIMGGLVAREAYAARPGEQTVLACELPPEGMPSGRPRRTWDWQAFGSTLGLLFVAELGDKTQLAVLALAADAGDLLAVAGGGALALVAVTALGVAGGRLLGEVVPQRLTLAVSALLFLGMGTLLGMGIV